MQAACFSTDSFSTACQSCKILVCKDNTFIRMYKRITDKKEADLLGQPFIGYRNVMAGYFFRADILFA